MRRRRSKRPARRTSRVCRPGRNGSRTSRTTCCRYWTTPVGARKPDRQFSDLSRRRRLRSSIRKILRRKSGVSPPAKPGCSTARAGSTHEPCRGQIYAYCVAYHMTGDERYLGYARAGLDYLFAQNGRSGRPVLLVDGERRARSRKRQAADQPGHGLRADGTRDVLLPDSRSGRPGRDPQDGEIHLRQLPRRQRTPLDQRALHGPGRNRTCRLRKSSSRSSIRSTATCSS